MIPNTKLITDKYAIYYCYGGAVIVDYATREVVEFPVVNRNFLVSEGLVECYGKTLWHDLVFTRVHNR